MEYKKNLEVLKECRPELYKKIVELDVNKLEKKNEIIETIIAKNESPVSVIEKNEKKIRINSSYNPEHEAKIWAKQFSFQSMCNYIVMYGFGNGYFARELQSHMLEKDYLLIYEPSAEVFIDTLHKFDLCSIFADTRICIGVDEINAFDFHKALNSTFNMEGLQNLKIATHPRYKELYIAEFGYFSKEVKSAAEQARLEYDTFVQLAEGMIRNQFMNIPKIQNSVSITQLKEIWNTDVPAIVVAAGPSLKDSLEQLRQAKGKAIIVAVDRIVQYLSDNNIEPDIVCTIDPNKGVANFSKGASVNVPMFCLLPSQPQIMNLHAGRKIICWCGTYLNEEYNRTIGERPDITLSGSVATVAVEVLRYLGARRICLVGQDLAYRGETTHVDGQVSGQGEIEDQMVEGINGDKVKTRYDWLNFKNWFEDFIVEHPEIEIIDTKTSGALIKGSKHMELLEAIGDVEVSVNAIVDGINSLPPMFSDKNIDSIERQLVADLNEMDKMKRKAKEGAGYCNDLINMVKQGKSSNKAIDSKVEKVISINKYLKETNLYKNLDDLILAYMDHDYVKVFTTKEEEEENLINVYDSSRSLYEATQKALKYVEPFMKEAVSKLQEQQ